MQSVAEDLKAAPAGKDAPPFTPAQIQSWRQRQFPCLHKNDPQARHTKPTVYLDHAGASLFPKSLMDALSAEFLKSPPGNPHSSTAMRQRVDAVREAVLKFVGASPSEFCVVFTSGATAALRLVGDCFDWQPGSTFGYTHDNHTSVLGIREIAQEHGCGVFAFDMNDQSTWSYRQPRSPSVAYIKDRMKQFNGGNSAIAEISQTAPHLIAVSAESNFDGARLDLSRLSALRPGPDDRYGLQKTFVLVDGSKLTQTIDLDAYPGVDFFAMSFYKMFGLPTGLGALVARITAVTQLIPSTSPARWDDYATFVVPNREPTVLRWRRSGCSVLHV